MQPPIFMFGGKPLPVDKFDWEYRFTSGTVPGGMTISVPLRGTTLAEQQAHAEEYWQLAGTSQTLLIEFSEIRNGREQRVTRTIKNLYLHDQSIRVGERGQMVAVFHISDLRYKWKGREITGQFNHTIRTNDQIVIEAGQEPPVPGQERIIDPSNNEEFIRPKVRGGIAPALPRFTGGPGDPIVAFLDVDILSKHRPFPRVAYRTLTLDYNDDDMTGFTGLSEGKPWTALRLVMAMLNGYVMGDFEKDTGAFVPTQRVPGLLDDGEWGGLTAPGQETVEDNGYVPPRLPWFFDPRPDRLAEMLRLAEVRLVVWHDGKAYLHPMYPRVKPTLPSITKAEESGWLYTTDLTYDRPSSIFVGFREEREEQFAFRVSALSAADNLIENVIQLPEREELEIDGVRKTYEKGTYLPIDKVLPNWATGFTTEQVRQHWFVNFESTVAEAIFGELAETISEQTSRRIAAIRSSWRQLLMLSRRDMEKVLDMRAESCTVLDAATGAREPSPVWLDIAMIRRAHRKRRPISAELRWENRYIELKDGPSGRVPVDDAPPSPFLIEVVDAVLGIIKLVPISEQGIEQIFQFAIDDPLNLGADLVKRNFDGGVLENAAPTEDWIMFCNLTMQKFSPNTSEQMTVIQVDPAAVGASEGAHTPYYIADLEETARYDIDGNLVNERMIRARATTIARSIYGSFQPRLTGRVMWPGLHDVYPISVARYASWSMSSDSAWSTTLDMTEPPPRRDPNVMLDPDLRQARLQLPAQ